MVKPLTPPISMGISMGRPDAAFHHSYPPNITVREMFAGFPTTFSINSQGLRGKEYPLRKPEGTFRILVFGDSFVFGTAVNDDQTFCCLLEKGLNAGIPDERYEVINCGVVSYSPLLEYLFLKEKMIGYSPDLVIFFYNFSDLQEDTIYARHARYGAGGDIIACSPFWINNHPDYVLLLRKNFYFFSYIYNKLSKSFHKISLMGLKDYMICVFKGKPAKEFIMLNPTLRSIELDPYYIFRDNSDRQVIRRYWDNSSIWLDKAASLSRNGGIDFLLVAFPQGHQISKSAWRDGRLEWLLEKDKVYDSPYPFEMLEGYAAKQGINFLNLRPYLLSHASESLYYDFDGHWTRQGHERVAEGILDCPLFKKIIEK